MKVFNDKTRKLTVVAFDGQTATGTQKTKRINFSGLSETASADLVHEAAEKLISLMNYDIKDVEISDVNTIGDDAQA